MLAAEGADIIAVDICEDIETNEYPLARPEDLDETVRLVEKEGQRAVSSIADVRDRAALSAAIDAAVAELGHLDIVVANAGICPLTAPLHHSPAASRRRRRIPQSEAVVRVTWRANQLLPQPNWRDDIA
jgi:NAD(P)-dependent dehydrogenase (short-subunit alcohol dehydrogenase family)